MVFSFVHVFGGTYGVLLHIVIYSHSFVWMLTSIRLYAKRPPGFAYRALLTACDGLRRAFNRLLTETSAVFGVLCNDLYISVLPWYGVRPAVITDAKDGLLHCERPPFMVPEAVFCCCEGRIYDCILSLFCHAGMAKQGLNNASLRRNAWQGRVHDACSAIFICHDFLPGQLYFYARVFISPLLIYR